MMSPGGKLGTQFLWAVCGRVSGMSTSSLQERLKQPPLHLVAAVEKLRMPLNAEEEAMPGQLHRLDDAVRGNRACLQQARQPLDRLMV